MIAASQMAQLRVRLADLPGFDATGLLLRGTDGAEAGIVVYDDGRDVLVHPEDGDREPAYWTKDQDSKPHTRGDEEPHVSTADARTRDALARWVAERVGFPPSATAPMFMWSPYAGIWELRDDTTRLYFGHGPEGDGSFTFALRGVPNNGIQDASGTWVSGWSVPALAACVAPGVVRLPDGSRLVDALALAAVARHVGGAK